MKRLGETISPVLVLTLTAIWLVLNQTVSPAQIILGVALSLAVSWSASALRPLRARVQRLDVVLRLIPIVLYDIVRSCMAVSRLVLARPSSREIRSGFLRIPLDLRDPHGLAALAIIVTSTPGTVWAGLSPTGDALTLHVLDLKDDTEWIQDFKRRYEKPLMRIFE